jgi:hypothetical protein
MRCNIAVLAPELSPTRALFLDALLDSLDAQIAPDEDFEVTIVTEDRADRPSGPRLKPAFAEPQSCYGATKGIEDLPIWYREQLLALYFAAKSESEFSLVLPLGSFAVAPLSLSALLPGERARTHWESVDYHLDWWETARTLTQRLPASPWEGPSILPAILNCDLARWTLDVIRRESHGVDPRDLLLAAIATKNDWSAMTLYATAAGSRLASRHHDAFASRALPLITRATLWSQDQAQDFHPAARGEDDNGLFTYVQTNEITAPEDVLDRLYACLGPTKSRS